MAKPNELLAASLERLKTAHIDGIVRSEGLGKTHLARLCRAGFLRPIIKGWYCTTSPAEAAGDTAWFSSYWSFVRQYLAARFGSEYCLTAVPSLLLHSGSTVIFPQLGVIRPDPGNQKIELGAGLSLFIYQDASNFPAQRGEKNGLQVMVLPEALVKAPGGFFRTNPADAAIALHLVGDVGPVLSILLENGRSHVAGRLAGAFRHVAMPEAADRILRSMRQSGYDVREENPFEQKIAALGGARPKSPYAARLRMMWAAMWQVASPILPESSPSHSPAKEALADIDRVYQTDAYNSLSIEGYRVSDELIRKVRSGKWNPDADSSDRKAVNAMAARGYYEAFQEVKRSVRNILSGADPVEVVRHDHHEWHQSLFAPAVRAGLLSPGSLAGYRNQPVYIRGSRHVPFPHEAVADAMEAFFDLLAEEESDCLRAVLGHFFFVFIHPYSDGNGRLARFLMNALLVAGGHQWTVILLEEKASYFEALETASAQGDIAPFARFMAQHMAAR